MKHPQPFCFIQQNEVYSQIETSTLNFIALTEKKKKKETWKRKHRKHHIRSKKPSRNRIQLASRKQVKTKKRKPRRGKQLASRGASRSNVILEYLLKRLLQLKRPVYPRYYDEAIILHLLAAWCGWS